jgi:radical SAM superfamily enzyme YgiQ (UPF0313 family)
VQKHGEVDVWFNPPPIPMTTEEMDYVFGMPTPAARTRLRQGKIPAYDMIRFSVNIMRGCFGGCTFCSITEHEGRIIQNRSEESIIREIEEIRDKVQASPAPSPTSAARPPTCTAWPARARDRIRVPQAVLRVPRHLPEPEHRPLVADQLYRSARALPGMKKILIALGPALRPGGRVAGVRVSW